MSQNPCIVLARHTSILQAVTVSLPLIAGLAKCSVGTVGGPCSHWENPSIPTPALVVLLESACLGANYEPWLLPVLYWQKMKPLQDTAAGVLMEFCDKALLC